MTSRPFALIILLGILCATTQLAAEIYFQEEALLTPPGGAATSFGRSVDISGNLAIVGGQDREGKAYIYHYDGGTWVLEATLKSDFPLLSHGFGLSVSISGDLAVVGNPEDLELDPEAWGGIGAVQVFRRSPDGSWSQEAKLFASNSRWFEHFGTAVDTDGQQIIAGPRDETQPWYCHVYVFGCTDNIWSEIANYSHLNSVLTSNDTYGNSVAIDGPWSAVGDRFWDHDTYSGRGDGAVERFHNLASDEVIRGLEYGDNLGYAVDVDGPSFAAGAPGKDAGGIDRGIALVGSVWIAPSDSHDYQYFGCDVALRNDLLAVTSEENTLYLFENSEISSWDEAAVIADVGKYVAMDEDHFIVGHPEANGNVGEVRVFSISQSTVGALITCIPSSGTLPFNTGFDIMLSNNSPLHHRRISNRIDVTIGNGQFYSSWRRGWDNFAPSSQRLYNWLQPIPDLPTLVGDNTFVLNVEDVTPAPYNQPPYPPAGDTSTDSCVLQASD